MTPCPDGLAHNAEGQCVPPKVTRNVFVFAAPPVDNPIGPPPEVPPPKVDYNIVFVRTPETPEGLEPIVVPPPQQKTLVYVLSKRPEFQGQEVIEVPSTPQQPEVYYVNYGEGENPQLPGGIDLQSALASAAHQQGQTVGGGIHSGGSISQPGGNYGTPVSVPQPSGLYTTP